MQGETMSDPLSTITTTVSVTGMTCSHCVASVTAELETLENVKDVSVELHAGGVSTAIVTSTKALAPAQIDAAIAEAGYAVVGVTA
jgi:copper chaperone